MQAWVKPLLVVLASFAIQPRAHAQCLRTGTQVVWSYPAQHERDVPLDVSVQVVTSNPISDAWRATIDGRQVRRDANGGYPLGELESASHHVFKLEEDRAPPGTAGPPLMFELSFDTGDGAASDASEPSVGTSELTTLRELDDPLCRAVQSAGLCLDVLYAMRAIHMQPDDAIAWQASLPGGSAKLWPSECAPVFGVADEKVEGCYELRGVSANGDLSPPLSYCPRKPRKSRSCGVVDLAANGGWTTLAASGLLLGLGAHRRRRARRMPHAHVRRTRAAAPPAA